MESNDSVEMLERACVDALLPLFEEALLAKRSAWAKWWHDPDVLNIPKGGKNYPTLRDFVIDAIKRQDERLGGGPFITHEKMLRATQELAANEEVVQFAPGGIRTGHVNPVWFTKAAEHFIEQQRFLDKKTNTFQNVGVLFKSQTGLYLIDQSPHVPHHH
jgi:hypothetical protein